MNAEETQAEPDVLNLMLLESFGISLPLGKRFLQFTTAPPRTEEQVAKRNKFARKHDCSRYNATIFSRIADIARSAPRYEATPELYLDITEAEQRWGRSLFDYTKGMIRGDIRQGRGSARMAKIALVGGKWTVLLLREGLEAAYGEPGWTSAAIVAHELRAPYQRIYNRLRMAGLRTKMVRAWKGSSWRVFKREEVEEEISWWKQWGRGSNTRAGLKPLYRD